MGEIYYSVMYVRLIVCVLIVVFIVGCNNAREAGEDHPEYYSKQIVDTSVLVSGTETSYINTVTEVQKVKGIKVMGDVEKITQINSWYKKGKSGEITLVEKKLNRIEYEFGVNGELLLHDTYRDDDELFFSERYVYEDGDLIAAKETNDSRFLIKSLPVYSNEGLIFKKILINGFDVPVGQSTILLEEVGRITEIRNWDIAKTKDKTILKFDKNAWVLERMYFEKPTLEAFGDIAETIVQFEYDSLGNVILERKYNPWGVIEDYKESLKSLWKHAYNESGDRIKSLEYDKKGELKQTLEITYEYDEKGNWIKCEIVKNGDKESSLKRLITYRELI